MVVEIESRIFRSCVVYILCGDIFKKLCSVYLAISGRILLLDRDFTNSVTGIAGIKVSHVNAISFRALTPRKIRHANVAVPTALRHC